MISVGLRLAHWTNGCPIDGSGMLVLDWGIRTIQNTDSTDESVLRRSSVLVRLAVTVVVSVVQSAHAGVGDEHSKSLSILTADSVCAAWKLREARAARFRAEWIHERTYTKYWANCHVPFARDEYVTLRFEPSRLTLDGERLRFDSGAVDDSGEVLLETGLRLDAFGGRAHDDARRVFRDDRIRYDAGRPRVDPREPAPTDWPRNLRPFTTIFDGRRSFQFLPGDHGREPEAYWFADEGNRFASSLHYLALILSVRPSWLGVSPATCRIESASEPIQGRECCVLVDETGLRREFWCDAVRDFVVLSYREECDVLGARMKNRIDISYIEDESGNWLPSAWTSVFFDNHGLMEQYAPATVIVATTGPELDDETFAVEPPAGTWVYDETTAKHHIVGAGGGPQPISAAELNEGLTHADLIARQTWTGRAGRAVRGAWRRAWLRFAVFLTLFGAVSGWLQRRRSIRVR